MSPTLALLKQFFPGLEKWTSQLLSDLRTANVNQPQETQSKHDGEEYLGDIICPDLQGTLLRDRLF